MTYGFTPSSTTWTKQAGVVAEQLRLAQQGRFIKTYNEVATPSSFFTAPSTVRSAYLDAAYWLALAGRLGYTQVLGQAGQFYRQAQSASTSTDVAARTAPLRTAIAALTDAGAARDKRAAPIFSVLQTLAGSEALARSSALQAEIGTGGQIKGALQQTAKDTGTPFAAFASYWSGRKPPGMGDTEWWIKKHAFWLAVVGGVGAVGYFYLRPLLAPLTRVRDAAAEAGHRVAEKAETRLSRVGRNPRRRRAPRRRR